MQGDSASTVNIRLRNATAQPRCDVAFSETEILDLIDRQLYYDWSEGWAVANTATCNALDVERKDENFATPAAGETRVVVAEP